MTTRGNADCGARGPSLAATIRLGLVDAAGRATSRETLAAADHRLYAAQRAGRSRMR
jgi:GGDEF domain-containing protein